MGVYHFPNGGWSSYPLDALKEWQKEAERLKKLVALGETIAKEIHEDHLRMEWLSDQVCEVYTKDKLWPYACAINTFPGSVSLREQIDAMRKKEAK